MPDNEASENREDSSDLNDSDIEDGSQDDSEPEPRINGFTGVRDNVLHNDEPVTAEHAEYLIMSYVLASGTSYTYLEKLLDLVNILAPQLQISRSKYLLLKKYNCDIIPSRHYTCNICEGYIVQDVPKLM